MVTPRQLLIVVLLPVGLATLCPATGLFRNGAGGRSMALGGASVARAETPLEAMWANPAGLTSLDVAAIELGYFGGYGDADFRNGVNGSVGIDRNLGHSGELAVAIPFANSRGALALSIIPESALIADWSYVDAPGGTSGAVTYGRQRHRSQFVVVRGALGVGWEINESISIGGSVGLVYEQVELEFPFIFQSAPGLVGFKTLLDLESDGFAWNGELGMTIRLREDLQLGVRYRSSTSIESEGTASGEAGAQLTALGLAPPRSDFNYDSRVSLSLPDILSAGLAWQATESLLVLLQVDWIPWSEHLDRLRVTLSNGDNPALPAQVVDGVPVGWEDRFTIRAGAEFDLNENWALRVGYIHAASAIPDANVTPVNAAIAEHSLSAGVGYRKGRWSIDAGYQLDLRHGQAVGTSIYEAGEYSNSKVSLLTHWWGLSGTLRF